MEEFPCKRPPDKTKRIYWLTEQVGAVEKAANSASTDSYILSSSAHTESVWLEMEIRQGKETGGETLLWWSKEPQTMRISPVLPEKQVWKIRPVLPASELTGLIQPGLSALLCPHVQIHHTSGKRPCSNNSTHSSNFKGLCQDAWWIPEAQGILLKAYPLKCYKSPGYPPWLTNQSRDILPVLIAPLEEWYNSPPHSRNGVFQWDSSFQQFPTRKNCRKKDTAGLYIWDLCKSLKQILSIISY